MIVSKRFISSLLCLSVLAGTSPVAMIAAQPNATSQEVVTSNVQANSHTNYNIGICSSKGGLVQVNPSNASEGEYVRITVTPNYGYKLDRISVSRSSNVEVAFKQENSNLYSFMMPDSDVSVDVTFEKKNSSNSPSYTPDRNYQSYPSQGQVPFGDIVWNAWYYPSVKYVYENNIMNGVTSRLFYPNMQVTRGMVCAVIANMEGGAERDYQIFWDVPQGEWYSDSVNWCSRNGIVNGYGNGAFGPEDLVTREQLVSILHKYAVYKGYETPRRANLEVYRDVNEISAYAYDTMSWAVASDVLSGVSYHRLNPQGTATRAELATMLMNFDIAVAY